MWRMREGFQDGTSKDGEEEVGPVPWWEGQWHQPTAFHSIPFPATSPTTGVLTGVVPHRKSCHDVETHGLDTQLAPLHISPAPSPHLLPSRQRRVVSRSQPPTTCHSEHHGHRYVSK